MTFPFDRILIAIERFTTHGVVDLRRRGITPQLGIVVKSAEESESFLAAITGAALTVGVKICWVDLRSHLPADRLSEHARQQLDTLSTT